MRKVLFIGGALIFALAGMASAGAKVAIVKSDNHAVVGEGWKLDILDFTQRWEAYWTKEHEAAVEAMVRKAVELAGGWPVKPGDDVVIKTNLVEGLLHALTAGKAPDPESANKFLQSMVTEAPVVRAVALLAKESGAKSVKIVAGPGDGDARAAFLVYGYKKMAKAIGVDLYDVNDGPWGNFRAPHALALNEYTLPKPVAKADVKISVAPLKTHWLAGITMTLKNWAIGIAPSQVYGAIKLGLPHEQLARVITDILTIAPIHYAVIDGIWGMEGDGPIGGDPVSMDIIIAGADPVAVDSVGAMTMGLTPDCYGHIRLTKEYGIGTNEDIEVVGNPIAEVRREFNPPTIRIEDPTSWGENVCWE